MSVQSAIFAFFQVVLIDITLAGDNAIVVGLAVQGLPKTLKRRAILIGIAAATVIRVLLSLVAVRMLALLGLTLAGGILLLWVCWKMFRELRANPAANAEAKGAHKTLRQAVMQIVVADLSMSLDNVLAVAGAAREHIAIMVGGLALSVVLMAVAADMLARLLERHRWIAWVGLVIVFYVSVEMIVKGWDQVASRLQGSLLF